MNNHFVSVIDSAQNGSITTLAGALYSQHEYNMVPFVNESTKLVQYIVLYCLVDYEDLRFALIPIGKSKNTRHSE